MADTIQVQQEQLALLQNKIYGIPFAAQDAFTLAQIAVQRIQIQLEERHRECEQELAKAVAARDDCVNTPADENGFKPLCHNQELAVERAAWQLHFIQGTIRDMSRAAEQHHSAGQRMLDFAQGPLMQGKAELAKKIQHLQQYSSPVGGANRVSITPGIPPPSSMYGGNKESGPESREAGKEGKER